MVRLSTQHLIFIVILLQVFISIYYRITLDLKYKKEIEDLVHKYKYMNNSRREALEAKYQLQAKNPQDPLQGK